MRLAQFLFKPKWQDKNAEVRRAAVAVEASPELVAALPEIARSDVDAGVRLAGLKRLNAYESWRERSTGDSDGEVRRIARHAYLSMLCARDARMPELPRRIAELDTLSQDELEKVASLAADRDLRSAALARVNRPALLADRAIDDADLALRIAALQRVTDLAALERIAERARKTDKTISRMARERIAAQRIGSGDATAIAVQARLLCERMEALMRGAAHVDAAPHAEIEREWQVLGNAVPADIQARYRGADALVRTMLENAKNPQIAFVASAQNDVQTSQIDTTSMKDMTVDNSTVDTADGRPALMSVELLASQARFDTALANAAAESQREREQRRLHLRELEELATQYSSVLEAGDVSQAHLLNQRSIHLESMIEALPAPLESRLAPLHARYAELKRWQNWANQQRRQALCESIESAAQANLHPDALATRVREARLEWQKLDASEGDAVSNSGLTRRFQALCQQALKPTKRYFNKRDELRRSQSDEIEALLACANALPEHISDWKALGTLRLDLGKALHSLDGVDPRVRTQLGKRIKEAIAAIAPRIDAHIESVEQAKQRLIERAQLLSRQTDGRSVGRDARELQQQWTALGNGKRAIDQRQWTAFREAIDAAFGKLDSAKREREAQWSAAHEITLSVIAEIETLQADTSRAVESVKAALRDLDARWQAQGSEDRTLQQRYRKAHDVIDANLKDAARRKHLSRYVQAMQKYTLLRELETGRQSVATAAASWAHLTLEHTHFSSALEQRHARLSADAEPVLEDESIARDRLVELEFLAGIETPDEDRQRRMNYQVQRLAARMRERAMITPDAALVQAMLGWFAQPPQSNDLEARFARAANAAISALP